MTADLTEPVELALVRDGAKAVALYETLCRRDDMGWLRFSLSSESPSGDSDPKYRITARWRNGPTDPPQPGPRDSLARQIDGVKAFVSGWMAAAL